MVDKINGKAREGEFLGKQLDFYSVAFTADLVGTASYAAFTPATGTLTFSGVGTAGDTIVINGQTITLVAASPVGPQALIGGTATATAQAVAAVINAAPATYKVASTGAAAVLTLTAITAGVVGNAITTTKVSTAAAFGAATLTGGTGDVTVENDRAKAAYKRRERMIETISLNGQPIIIGTFGEGSGVQTLKFAIEHASSWNDSEAVLAADAGGSTRGNLDTALELVPGVTSVTVTKSGSL